MWFVLASTGDKGAGKSPVRGPVENPVKSPVEVGANAKKRRESG